MMKNTITLVLDGKISLGDFAKAVGGLFHLVDSLQEEVAEGHGISWTVDSLEIGSAIATIRGEPVGEESIEHVEAVVVAYEEVGAAAASGNVIPFRPSVANSIREITSLDSENVRSVRFETAERDSEINLENIASVTPIRSAVVEADSSPSIGVVTGRVQSISSRGRLRFTIYDLQTDKAVSCYLRSGMEEEMRDAWGKIATVRGIVRRDDLGRPTTVRQVESASVVEEDERDYRSAFGILSPYAGDELPEESIRRIRDDV